MKTRKVLDISACGQHLKGYYEDGKVNPWRLYLMTWELRKCGCGMSEHKRLISKWANFISMACAVSDFFRGNAEAWRD